MRKTTWLWAVMAIVFILSGCASGEPGRQSVKGETILADMGLYVLIPDGWTYEQEEKSITITDGTNTARLWRVVGGTDEEAEASIKALAETWEVTYRSAKQYQSTFYYAENEEDGVWTREYCGYIDDKYNTFHMVFTGDRTNLELRTVQDSILI